MSAIQTLSFRPGEQRGEPKSTEMTWTIRFFVNESGEGQGEVVTTTSPDFQTPIIESLPQLLPNTQEAMRAMQSAVRYPEAARAAGLEGDVIVQFVVDETGAVVDPVILRGVGGGLDEEALRGIQTLRFAPATVEGKPSRVSMTLPVRFRLSAE